jgi:hypothetical protein
VGYLETGNCYHSGKRIAGNEEFCSEDVIGVEVDMKGKTLVFLRYWLMSELTNFFFVV